MKQFILFVFLFQSVMTYGQACDSLEAPCLGTFSRNGYYFDLEAVNDIRVTGLNYLVQNAGTRDISLWYRSGTYFGFEGVASNWTLLGTDSNITPANGGNCPLPLNRVLQDFNICIPAGQKYGFYLAVSAGTGTVETHNNLPEGTVAVQDVNVKLITGKGQFGIGNFSGTLMGGLTFQGSIRYSCQCAAATDETDRKIRFHIYPNPAVSEVRLRIQLNDNLVNIQQIRMTDAFGKIIRDVMFGEKEREVTISISDLPSAIYFLCIYTNDGLVTRKLVKE